MNCEDCSFYERKTNTEGICTKDNSEVEWNGGCPCWDEKED